MTTDLARVSGTVIIPGQGSDLMEDMEIVWVDGRWWVTGTVFDDQSGLPNMPEGPCLIPFGMTLPVSCIRSIWPESEPWPLILP